MKFDPFENWTQGELVALFCTGNVMELVAEGELKHTSLLSFPVLTTDGMSMYNELLDMNWYPEKHSVKAFIRVLRNLSGRDVPMQSYLLH